MAGIKNNVMKKIIVFTLFLISITASAQNKVDEDTTARLAISEAGKPDGKKVEMKMTRDGGTLVSSDGNLQLIIPPGALSKKTSISIQPITNKFSNGNGQAYRLEPSGIHFLKPAQLIFNYTTEESEDSMQLQMGIAMQDNTGQWYGLRKFTLDTVAKTISGHISHFSDWSKFDALKITPSTARLKVGKDLLLTISGIEPSPKDEGDGELVKLERKPKKTIWSVNNIKGGNRTVGLLNMKDGFTSNNFYSAPRDVPDQNPVAVTVRLEGLNWNFNGTRFNTLRLISNILIYDNAYEVTMIHRVGGNAGSALGKATYIDNGSFVVSVNGKETKIIEKINKNTTAEFGYGGGDCIVTPMRPGSGSIHIAGVQSIKVTPPASPSIGNPWIEIVFKRTPSILPLLKIDCPPRGGKGNRTVSTTAQGAAAYATIAAFPHQIKFEAKDGEQTILEIGKEGDDIYAKFTVKPLEDD
jgi:hypothetical protein